MVPKYWSVPPGDPRPSVTREASAAPVVRAVHHELGTWFLHAEPDADLLFCENESNAARLWGATDSPPFPKDGIVDHVVHGTATVNPAGEGTKAAVHRRLVVPAGGAVVTHVRFTTRPPDEVGAPFADADDLFARRRAEADEFYAAITRSVSTPMPR